MASVHPISHSGTENGLLGSSQTVMWWMLALLYGLVWCSLGGPFLTETVVVSAISDMFRQPQHLKEPAE